MEDSTNRCIEKLKLGIQMQEALEYYQVKEYKADAARFEHQRQVRSGGLLGQHRRGTGSSRANDDDRSVFE